ncbi:MAG: hypothetical protein LBP81_05905 [Treponema sp.]|jgi:hypothetical protein|nr:hypothetical protein [Treponema sp.]
MAEKEGIFFTHDELLALFPRLKSLESVLGKKERAVLIKMEKVLYKCLSISEIETCLRAYREAR